MSHFRVKVQDSELLRGALRKLVVRICVWEHWHFTLWVDICLSSGMADVPHSCPLCPYEGQGRSEESKVENRVSDGTDLSQRLKQGCKNFPLVRWILWKTWAMLQLLCPRGLFARQKAPTTRMWGMHTRIEASWGRGCKKPTRSHNSYSWNYAV